MLPLHPGGPDAAGGVTVLGCFSPGACSDPDTSSFLFSSNRLELDGSTVLLALTLALFIFRVSAWKRCTRRRRGSRCAARLAGVRRAGHAHRRYDVTHQL